MDGTFHAYMYAYGTLRLLSHRDAGSAWMSPAMSDVTFQIPGDVAHVHMYIAGVSMPTGL